MMTYTGINIQWQYSHALCSNGALVSAHYPLAASFTNDLIMMPS